MSMMRRPTEITPMEWEILTSPENYYCDGEITGAEAERYFRQKVASIVQQRRGRSAQTPSAQPTRKCSARTSSGNLCERDADRGYAFCWQHRKQAERAARRQRWR